MPDLLSEDFFPRQFRGRNSELTTNLKYTLHATTPDALTHMRAHKEPYNTVVKGLPILVLPGVWSPAYDWSSLFHIESMPNLKGLDLLEIGSGTGIISVFAARSGAKKIVAVDINPKAVRNTQLNFSRFGIENAEVIQSDVFSNVRGKFDLIYGTHHIMVVNQVTCLSAVVLNERVIETFAFFSKVGNILKPWGKVVFGCSASGDIPLIESLIAETVFGLKENSVTGDRATTVLFSNLSNQQYLSTKAVLQLDKKVA